MYLLDGILVTSASDLTVASGCEFAFVRGLERRLGWHEGAKPDADPFLERLSRLGDEHERRHLADLREAFPGGVVDIGTPNLRDRADLLRAAAETVEALRARTPVVFQAVFFDESDPAHPYVGLADFLVLGEAGYRVVDTKLARRAKVTALLQLAAYHEQLVRLGVPADPLVELRLGDGTADLHDVADIAPVHRRRRDRLHTVLDGHRADGQPVTWGDERYVACGRCDVCQAEVDAADDVARVAGIRWSQRAALREAGITTVAALAALDVPPAGLDLAAATFERLVAQARLLTLADAQRAAEPDDGPHAPPPFEVADLRPVAQLPPPDPEDLFFDFEGDPMWRTEGPETTWGLDYLFGWVDATGAFSSLWADDLAEEKAAFEAFVDFLVARREQHPGLHVYHYAAYERTHLTSLAQRHGTREHVVDQLLREGVLVDLYPVVRRTVLVGSTSYSLKKLEPLYDETARSGVTSAADSVMAYVAYCDARDAGDANEAGRVRAEIEAYNADDCRSTLHLRDWLIGLGAPAGVRPGDEVRPELDDTNPYQESELAVRLDALAAQAADRGDDAAADAYALVAAAVDYHARENKAFWWEHFARLNQPADEWQDTRGVFTIDHVVVEAGWHRQGRQRNLRRHLRLHGRWAPGSGLPGVRSALFLLYDVDRPPYAVDGRRPEDRVARKVTVLDLDEESGALLVEETTQEQTWSALPTHLTPDAPPRADNVKAAIDAWAQRVTVSWPDDAASLLVRRLPPRRTPEQRADPDDAVRAVVGSLLADDRSYLAVQGPPGTGKTYVASHAVAELVRDRGWKVGVVAQSHKVVENLLTAVVRAGLPPELVAKAPRSGVADPPDEGFTWLRGTNPQPGFAAGHAATGYVLGGTAWDFTNRNRVAEGQLDLLVIEEAGQFSLAPTIAVATSADRLLLLGDPQQLPQVSQGIHPAPVDGSALAHLAAGADVLPEAFGYFLAETRRMDAALTDRVSDLAYRGELAAHPSTGGRSLAGVEPGVHPVPVEHVDDDVCSVEEAAAVVALVQRHLGLAWTDGDGARPLAQRDVLVVTPYNAQVELVRAALDRAGFHGVQVGTVDKFQGREAVVVVVSMAASSPGEVPRGMGFLLSRNRLNVSVSRAKWAAYVVHSPALVDYLPTTVPGLTDLSRFLRLVEPPAPSRRGSGSR